VSPFDEPDNSGSDDFNPDWLNDFFGDDDDE
jgi:hypothetical protein